MTNPQKRIVSLTFLTALVLAFNPGEQSAAAFQEQIRKPQQISLNVTVTDKFGEPVTGLESADFEISIDKKPAQIVSLNCEDSPVSIGLALDSSVSMAGRSAKLTAKYRLALRQALQQFLELGNRSNQYFLLTFNRNLELLMDWTTNPATILDGFDRLRFYGETALYDGCYLAINKLQSGSHAKRALIVISDGQDNRSQYKFKQLQDLLRETDVSLYAMDFPTHDDYGGSIGHEGHIVLDELSVLSGGRAYLRMVEPSDRQKMLDSAFETIARELRSQYAISIISPDSSASKKWRKVKVKVKRRRGITGETKDLFARTREGFYTQ